MPAETFRYDQAANLLDDGGPGAGAGSTGQVRDNRLRVYQDRRYDWDRFGRLRRKRIGRHTEQRFRYDAEHRLVAVDIQDRQGAHSVRFDYDPIGRRIAKTHVRADGRILGATEFLWDGMRLAGERSASQQSLYLYVDEGSHEALARVDGIGAHQQVLHFHADANGAPEEMTDGEGRLLWQVRYRVWGNTVREEYHPTQLAPQNLRFQGQYLDRETGLHYNTFRFFDPDVGRFTASDPIGLEGGLNLYQYASNPILWIDPWGWACGGVKWTRKGWKHVYERHVLRTKPRWSHKSKFAVGDAPAVQKLIGKTVRNAQKSGNYRTDPRTGRTRYEHDFKQKVGEKVDKQTGIVTNQEKVVVVLDRHGSVVTSFPSD